MVYFVNHLLDDMDSDLKVKVAQISGSDTGAIYASEKHIDLSAKVITLSDSDGTVHDKEGIDEAKLDYIKTWKEERRSRIREFAEEFDCEYYDGKKPWHIPWDIALPCVTQNELTANDAQNLQDSDGQPVAEGANIAGFKKVTETMLDYGTI